MGVEIEFDSNASAPEAAEPAAAEPETESTPIAPAPAAEAPAPAAADPPSNDVLDDAPPIAATTINIPDYILVDMERRAAEPQPRPQQPPPSPPPRDNDRLPPGGSRSENANSANGAKDAKDADEPSNDEPFDDAALIRRGYRFVRAFDYVLPDGTRLYEQRRYELLPTLTPSPKRPRKRFLPRRESNGAWVLGTGPRRVLYNWPAVMRAGPGATVLVPEGEGKVDDLTARGLLATTVISHAWDRECVAALAGRHVIILADHDEQGAKYATAAATALRAIAASVRIVAYQQLWQHLPETTRAAEPQPHDDISDWLRQGGDASRLLEICRAIAPEGTELDEWDAGEVLGGALPEPRQWLTAGQFCRTFLSGLVAPGDVGKTTLRLTQAIELATGRELVGLRVFQRCRVLVLSFEDDRAELHRRLLAICKHHGIDPSELKGWLFCRDLNAGPKLAELDSKGRRRQVGALEGMLRRAIARTRCDLLILDPFVKLHGLNESDNPDMDFVCSLLIKIAQDCNIAVDSPAHTHKGAITAGDADARRGASAQRDAGRLDFTLTVMSEDEAKQFGIAADVRKSYMRLDKAKANIVRAVKARWFWLASVRLNNATALYPDGDEVQAVERWEPPETWAGVDGETLNAILDAIDAGLGDGRRYIDHGAARDRAAWLAVQKRCPDKPEAQCREMIKQWVKAEVLFRDKYPNPLRREEENGLFVDPDKRPAY